MVDKRWTRINELFEAACDRDAAERDAFLIEACGDDVELLEELRALLAADAREHDLVELAVRDAAGAFVSRSVAGRKVGPWRLMGELGQGGMGMVYLAERADGEFEQRAAIKLIRGGMDTAGILSRFRRERQILARLDHPNIARLLDGGLTEDGRPYLAMEYVDGEPLNVYCDRRGLSVDERLHLYLEVCQAVRYAHSNLVVHRDLKPANILVTAAGRVRLLDFGIARLLEEDDGATPLTETGLRAMTPAYASPEQVRGEPVGTATDVYSLGVILYELIAGVRPYEVDSRNLVEVERVVCRADPGRPSSRMAKTTGIAPETGERIAEARRTDLVRLRKKLAGDLDVICLHALRKEPERRYGSVEALGEDVRRHLDGLPVQARPDTLGYRLRKLTGRHRLAASIAAAAVVGVASLTAFFLVRLADERDQARQEAEKATAIAGFLQDLFEVSDPSESRGETVTARELLDTGAERIAHGLEDQPEVQATMMRVIGDVYRVLGLRDRARPLLEQALERQRAQYGDTHDEVATTQLALGLLYQSSGDFEAAEALLRASLDTRRELYGERHAAVGESLSDVAFLEETRGNYQTAEDLYRQALELHRTIYPGDHPRVVYSVVKLGGMLRRIGELDAAEPLLREGLAAQRRLYGDVHPDVAATARNLAALLRDKGSYAEADTLYREVLATRRALLGDDHPEVGVTLNSYALLLDRMGEADRAVAIMREFIGLLERTYDAPHPDLAAAYSNLAGMIGGDEAVSLYLRSMDLQDQVFRPDHPQRAFPRVGLALLYMDQGRPRDAEPLLREALAVRRAALEPGHRYVGQTLSELGACLAAQSRHAEAEPLLIEAVEILEAAEGADASSTRLARERLAALHAAMEAGGGD